MHKAIVLAGLLVPAVCLAQLEDLENAGPVSAVQERYFRMQAELDLSVGVLPADPYTKGLYAQAAFGYHFSDYIALMGRFAYAYPLHTSLREQLERDFGVLPTAFEEVQFFAGGDVMITPFYGKLSVLNKSVVHGEVFFLVGFSVFKYTSALGFAPNLGIGARVFVNRWVSVRLDLTDSVVLRWPPFNASNVPTLTLSLALNFGSTE